MFVASVSIDLSALPPFALLCEDGRSIEKIVVITWKCRHLTLEIVSVFCKPLRLVLEIRPAAAALFHVSVGSGTVVHAHVLYMVMLLKLTQER